MEDIWEKLDAYTRSDHLNSSDDEFDDVNYCRRTEHLYISNKEIYQVEVDRESFCSEDVETEQAETEEKLKSSCEEKQVAEINLHKSLLDEMRKSELHCKSEARNVQEKIDEMSAEKSQQKEELNEMQHKAQVISRSARMPASDVLSTITSSETLDHEESGEMDEYYERIRSINTDNHPCEVVPENERELSSSDVGLPNIAPLSSPLNTGVMKSKADVARQGSMKARRKPTAMKRKSWTPGMDEINIREQDEEDETEPGDVFYTQRGSEDESELPRTGSFTPSSSEDEKEVVKQPHLRSGIALPGLGDALKIQMTRSELKRPTALGLVKTAKDAKENEVTREDKQEASLSKPEWMKEVEERKKKPKVPARKHKTLPARCSELDTLFEQRKQVESTSLEGSTIYGQPSRQKSLPGEDIDPELQKMFDPELQKMFEKRKNLKPLDVENYTSLEEPTIHASMAANHKSMVAGHEGPFVAREIPRPKKDNVDPELKKMFERRKNLKPDGEGTLAVKEGPTPKSFHGDEIDSELNKMFEKRKNLQPAEGRVGDNGGEEGVVFKPRNVHLRNSQATELDKIFEKRKQLRPVEGAGSHTSETSGHPASHTAKVTPHMSGTSPHITGAHTAKAGHSSQEIFEYPSSRKTSSGIVRARFYDTKLEPLPSRGEVKVATVAEVRSQVETTEVRTVKNQVERDQRRDSREVRSTRQEYRPGQSAHSNSPHPSTTSEPPPPAYDSTKPHAGGAQVAHFVFDASSAASRATVGQIPGHVTGRGDNVISSRDKHGLVSDPRDVNVKKAVVSPTLPKSDTRSFLKQLSGRPSSGQSHPQGKSVSQPRRVHPIDLSIGKGMWEPDTNKEYVIPSKSLHSNLGSPPGGDPRSDMPHSLSTTYVSSAQQPLPLSLPPISSQYSTQSPYENSNSRHLRQSLSHPSTSSNHPPTFSDQPNHPPLNAKTSDPQTSSPSLPQPHVPNHPPAVYTPHSPEADRVALSPRSVRVREVTRPVREIEMDCESRVRSVDAGKVHKVTVMGNNASKTVSDTSMLREVISPELCSEGRVKFVHSYAVDSTKVHKVTTSGNEIRRNKDNSATGNEVRRSRENRVDDDERPSNTLNSCGLQDSTERSQNIEMTSKANCNLSAPVSNGLRTDQVRGPEMSGIVRMEGRENAKQRMNRAQSPGRTSDEKMYRHRTPVRSNEKIAGRIQSPERTSDQRMCPLDRSEQRICKIRNPNRLPNLEKSTMSNGYQNVGRLTDEKMGEMQSSSKYPGIKRIQNFEKSNDQRPSRSRSSERSEMTGAQNYYRSDKEERRVSRVKSPERWSDERNGEGYTTSQGVRNYKSSVHVESLHQRSGGSNREKSITNGTHGDYGEKVTGTSEKGDRLSRDNVERLKIVTVTEKSLTENPVRGYSPDWERTGDKDVNGDVAGVVNGDFRERRGVKAQSPKIGAMDGQSSESPGVPKWKQELREKKRLKEKQGKKSSPPRQQPEQSGNDIAEWQERLRGIRKTWGAEDSKETVVDKDGETITKDDKQDTETYV